MNILLVSEVYLPTVSGVASSTDSIARFLAKHGHKVYLVCPKPVIPYTPEAIPQVHLIYTPSLRDPFFVNKPMTIIPLGLGEIVQTIATHAIDVVHIQEPGALGIMTLIVAKLYRLPIVGAMHFSVEQFASFLPWKTISMPLMKLYIRLIYPHYAAIMVPTATAKENLVKIIGQPERIYPISNGVDTSLYRPRSADVALLRKKYHIDPGVIVFLYVGRLDADKNIETILKALARTSGIHFILAGVGKQKKLLQLLAHQLVLSSRITWMDQLSTQSIVELYQLSDGFIIMSPIETQSIVALQAVACGLPVIAANAGALPELVHHDKNGYLVDAYDDRILAKKMTYLAARPDVRVRMGKESRSISLAHRKSKVLQTLETLYGDLKKSWSS